MKDYKPRPANPDTQFITARGPSSGLATMLSKLLDRTVIDKTGLTGKYDFTLEIPRSDSSSIGTSPISSSTAASVFSALQEQLGLKLEATKSSVDILVIDHIEKPTEN